MDIVRAPRGYKNYIVIYSYIIHTYVYIYIYIHMRSQCSDSQVIFPCEFALMLISDYSQKGWSSFPAILKDHKTSNLSDETSITWTENHHSHIFPIHFPWYSHMNYPCYSHWIPIHSHLHRGEVAPTQGDDFVHDLAGSFWPSHNDRWTGWIPN